MKVNDEEFKWLSLADLIAIPSRNCSFYGLDVYQYDEMLKAVKEEVHKRVTNIFIF